MSDAPTQTLDSPIERIYDWIELSLPGVVHPVVQAAVFSAFEEFCSRSTYWRIPVTWTMAAGVAQLDFNDPPLDANTRVRWVLDICGGNQFRLAAQAVLVDNSGDTSKARTGTATLVCVPNRLAQVFPDWVEDWTEQIQAGVLQRLYAQPGKTYSNAPLAQAAARQFRVGIQLARIEAGRMINRQSVVYPYYARGRQNSGWVDACCCTGGSGTDNGGGPDPPDPNPGDLPVVAISPGVITDAPPPGAPVLAISPGVIGDPPPPGGGLSANPTSMVFASTPLGTNSAPQQVVFTNTTSGPVTITDVAVTGDFSVTALTT